MGLVIDFRQFSKIIFIGGDFVKKRDKKTTEKFWERFFLWGVIVSMILFLMSAATCKVIAHVMEREYLELNHPVMISMFVFGFVSIVFYFVYYYWPFGFLSKKK